ncbi:D-glycero-beta-D-manno-heptose 1,7-bisphosphate 7-phosphatase [Pseudoalteromonas xiamenensis]|jgi:D-glycero-D-manno-heptose 1,7-bisphosphate phosphatase|uniref:D,D-heptose 1,7-bisphosphate phosphatase n=1 Tax=Pseudoalteromonas xiamenensis TaxID=882626 RepID=A0A975DGQ8_9GAMM|nr:D-glycero-beta-D-manno-heptose 1,7-bisphosphate 7-phosphatase [Pseudoalteromonas xiamenensis]QTH70792.1 D-glycero-beta-D-manno-heptose 1,7-bisphosphate 7-phosphatase [Pseudoalteromonas xiamenensis]
MQKAIFLDRDGVVNVDHAYVHKADDFQFIEGVFEACKLFQANGYALVIVTNQSGIGRGYYSEAQFHELTNWMCEEFQRHGVEITGVYFCPHHPKNAQGEYLRECDCRKPYPGMLLQAANEHVLDLASSVMVGDKSSDMEAAHAAGVPNRVLVRSGQKISESCQALATHVVDSLAEVPTTLGLK